MSEERTPEEEVATAERAVYDAISSLHSYGRPVDTQKLTEAVSALVDLKIALAVEYLADRVQDASGIRP
jgi:hypothetical protein